MAHAHIAVNALHWEVIHHAVAAQRLDGGAAHALGHFAGKQLGHGRFLQAGQAGIAQAGRVPNQLARRLKLRGAVGQAKAHGLVVKDGLAKALALFAVVQGAFKGRAGHAHALRGNADAPAFQGREGNFVALALGTDQVLGRDAAVVQIDLRGIAAVLAQLVFQPRHLVAGVAGGHDKGAHALFACGFIRDGNDDGHLAVLAAGDELLYAVDDVIAPVLDRRGAQGRSVGADMRLGQAERAQHLAARQGGEPLLLLRRVAVAHEDGVHRAVGHADGGAGAAVTGRDFFQHQRQAEVVQPRAAVFLGHADAVSAQRGQALVDIFGEVVLFVPAGGVGGDFGLHKLAHGIAHHVLVWGQ